MCAIADGYPYKLYINLLLCSAVIQRACQQPAKKISNRVGKIKPDIKTKGFFSIMAMIQKNGFNPADVDYWKAKGWTSGKRPWKN